MNTLLALIAIAVACVDIYFRVKHNKQSRKTIYLSKEAPPKKEEPFSLGTFPVVIKNQEPPPPVDAMMDNYNNSIQCPFCKAPIAEYEKLAASLYRRYECGTVTRKLAASKNITRGKKCTQGL